MKSIRILFLILCVCFVSVAWGQRPAGMVRTNWSEFHFRHDGTRLNPYESVLNVNNVGSLHPKWTYRTGHFVESSPAVVNGVVYFGSSGGSSDGILYALKASTGALLWSYATGYGDMHSSPAVANGVVYIGGKNVYALNASTGALLWNYATGDWVDSSPTVVNGVVYVGSDDANVYALNANTGATVWSYTTGGSVKSSPAVANGVVYFGSRDHNVYALNAATGAKVWSYATSGFAQSSPRWPMEWCISARTTARCTR